MMGRMKIRKRLAKNQQLLENQQKTGKKPIFPKNVQTFQLLSSFFFYSYWIDFVIYLVFVSSFIAYMIARYGMFGVTEKSQNFLSRSLFEDKDFYIELSFATSLLIFIVIFLMIWEISQACLRRQYCKSIHRYLEWAIIISVFLQGISHVIAYVNRRSYKWERYYIACITLLGGFIRLYLLFIRISFFPKVTMYIEMFKTVLKTYAFLLITYLVFILSFAYCFHLIFNPHISQGARTKFPCGHNHSHKLDLN